MQSNLGRSVSWSPTVALSWFWGLGFFYAIHVTLTNGWLGFLAFALPNAIGLCLFGWIVGAPHRSPEKVLASIGAKYTTMFLFCQMLAVSATIFGFAKYAWLPMFGPSAWLGIVILILVACSIGHAVPLRNLRLLHVAYLALGVGASSMALAGFAPVPEAGNVPLAAFDERFYGLALPTLVGFLLGPWMDVQHWQRAVEIRRHGGSIRVAYVVGAGLFLVLLTINAFLAAAVGTAGNMVSADGLPEAQPAVALAIGRNPVDVVVLAFTAWTIIAAASTIDSFYAATRWRMTAVTARSTSPLLAFIPGGFIASPVWIMIASFAIAAAMIGANLSLMYVMLPFASFLVGAAACLVCETLGARSRYDAALSYMIGLTAALIFVAGYLTPVPAFLAIAPLVGLIGAFPTMLELFGFVDKSSSVARVPIEETVSETGSPSGAAVLTVAREDAVTAHGFDGQWFIMHMIPTYDDTNSVGNIYFANYVRWVGKTRELFFNVCMPQFDLKTTSFYVLTKSFTHDFRREAGEFEPITVRLKIASHNRKFVVLAHEIYSRNHGLLGRGEQSLMFVDMRIPTKPAGDSDLKPAVVPRRSRPP
ncbi:MAG: acyl-CoA thioesterase, partial [Methylobacterium sp.]|nr:acyl-CoA thioesterase [Methylobacterium sp.]